MGKIIAAIVIILLVIVGVYFFTRGKNSVVDVSPSPSATTTTATATPSASATPISGTGKVIVEITDKAADMAGVSDVQMTLSKVEVHSQAKGWVTVMKDASMYKLLSLKASGHLQFAGSASISADTLDQVKLTISKVIVVAKDGKQKTAILPGKEFAVMTSIMVNGKQTSSIKIDVLADKSLHTTATGEYVFAPTAEVESRSNTTATVDSRDVVILTGGTVSSNTKAGMDLDGTVKADFQLDANAVINLQGGVIKLGV